MSKLREDKRYHLAHQDPTKHSGVRNIWICKKIFLNKWFCFVRVGLSHFWSCGQIHQFIYLDSAAWWKRSVKYQDTFSAIEKTELYNDYTKKINNNFETSSCLQLCMNVMATERWVIASLVNNARNNLPWSTTCKCHFKRIMGKPYESDNLKKLSMSENVTLKPKGQINNQSLSCCLSHQYKIAH